MNITAKNIGKINIQHNMPPGLRNISWQGKIDFIRYKSIYYLAFGSVPTQFPSRNASIHLLSSDNGTKWCYEHTFESKQDINDPNLFIHNDDLHIAFYTSSRSYSDLSPRKILYAKKLKNKWSKNVEITIKNRALECVKVFNDSVFIITYQEEKNQYKNNRRIYKVFKSDDLLQWHAVLEDIPVYNHYGSIEASQLDFDFDIEGNVWGILTGYKNGSTHFYLPKNNYSDWKMRRTRIKHKNPRIFNILGKTFLFSGSRYGKQSGINSGKPGMSLLEKFLQILKKSKVSVYEIDKISLKTRSLLNLPLRGTWTYQSLVKTDDGGYLTMYYNSVGNTNKNRYRLIQNWTKTNLYACKLYFQREVLK